MVGVSHVVYTEEFEREVKKIKNNAVKERIKKQIDRLIGDPEVGKPLRYGLKGERTVYIKPYRLIYSLIDEKVYLLRFEHRKEVY